VHNSFVRKLRFHSVPVLSVLVLLGAACLAGCVTDNVDVSSAYQDKAPRNQTFTRVLVVGVTPDVNQRCGFEFFLASQIKSESTVGIRSCDAVEKKEPLTVESIEQAVAKYQADAVVATSLVATAYDTKEGGSMDTRGGAYYKATDSGFATGYYGVYGVPVIYGEFQTAAALSTVEGEAHVFTKLFETKGKTLVYTLDTVAKDLETRDAGLHDVAAAIADRLRKEKLIR
jgi:hypothetical protein